jgi:cytochrome c oxidase subunit 2
MFEAAGTEAIRVLDLFWVLLAGAIAIWLLLAGAFWYAVRNQPREDTERKARRLILIAGVVLPTVLLVGLVIVGLQLMADLRTSDPDLAIRVTGEQYWWRVEYLADDGTVLFETANVIALPQGARAELQLRTGDVIHAFWVPALAGKVDMVPGMDNRLLLEPLRTGSFRGQCAEFCGTGHARMAFTVDVMAPAAFASWLDRRRADAIPATDGRARAGQEAFLAYGCGACHQVRGTPARGRVGPDLTHFGARSHLAAATAPNDRRALLAWLRHPEAMKPGARMPAFDMLAADELTAIVTYLRSLQ